MPSKSDEAKERKRKRDREKKAAKKALFLQEASDAEIEAKRSKNTKIKVRGRLDDAMLKGDLSTVVWLIEHHGADPNMLRRGRNCFFAACQYGHQKIVQYLAQHTSVDTAATDHWYSSYDEEVARSSLCTGWDVAIAEGFQPVHNMLLSIAADHPKLKNELPRQKQRQAEADKYNALRLEANQAHCLYPEYDCDDDATAKKISELYSAHPNEIVYVHVRKRKPLKLDTIGLIELRKQNHDIAHTRHSGGGHTNSTNTKQMRGRITQLRKIC